MGGPDARMGTNAMIAKARPIHRKARFSELAPIVMKATPRMRKTGRVRTGGFSLVILRLVYRSTGTCQGSAIAPPAGLFPFRHFRATAADLIRTQRAPGLQIGVMLRNYSRGGEQTKEFRAPMPTPSS